MTAHSTMGLLYTISEGSQGESPSISPQSAGSMTSTHEMEQEMKAPTSILATDIQSKQKDDCTFIKNGPFNKSKSHPRLAQLRGQIRVQVREHSPRNQMLELVDKVTHAHVGTKAHIEGSKHNGAQESTNLGQCCSPTCFASELEGKLHVELSALRQEVKASLEALRTELGQELRALHRDVKVCCHHCPAKESDHPRTGDKKPEWKSVFRKVKSKEEQEPQSPVRLDGQIKARSVPSLIPSPGPSRNQVLLRAMTTIAAKNALVSSIGIRSDSDPIQTSSGKQSHKTVLKSQELTSNGQSNGNWSKKITNRTVAPLSQNGASTAKTH
ncbi:uncharacterized protein WCC33_003157 [Rhinophrynus dorsalis]